MPSPPSLHGSREQKEMTTLTRDVDLELATLAEGAGNDPQLPSGQVHLEPHEELDVGLLFEQGAADHTVVVHHLCPHPAPERALVPGKGWVATLPRRPARGVTGDARPLSPLPPATDTCWAQAAPGRLWALGWLDMLSSSTWHFPT